MSANRAVFRSVVPINDQWHPITLTGPILHVATRTYDHVEMWHLHNPGEPGTVREFRVYGTGHGLTDDTGRHIGTALSPEGGLVWHLFERRSL